MLQLRLLIGFASVEDCIESSCLWWWSQWERRARTNAEYEQHHRLLNRSCVICLSRRRHFLCRCQRKTPSVPWSAVDWFSLPTDPRPFDHLQLRLERDHGSPWQIVEMPNDPFSLQFCIGLTDQICLPARLCWSHARLLHLSRSLVKAHFVERLERENLLSKGWLARPKGRCINDRHISKRLLDQLRAILFHPCWMSTMQYSSYGRSHFLVDGWIHSISSTHHLNRVTLGCFFYEWIDHSRFPTWKANR